MNEEALTVNEQIVESLPGDIKSYHSIDSVVSDDQEEANNYPLEFINPLNPTGMPPYTLNLKVNSIVMLLRNFSIEDGLSGTWLIVKHLHDNVIVCYILTGIRSCIDSKSFIMS